MVAAPSAALHTFPKATRVEFVECSPLPSVGRRLRARPALIVSRSPSCVRQFVRDTWQLKSGSPSNHWSQVGGPTGKRVEHSGRGYSTRSQMDGGGGEDEQGATPVFLEKDDVAVSAATSSSAGSADVADRWHAPPPLVPVVSAEEEAPVWASTVWASSLDLRRRIFCNRSLNMKGITAVGFDMDYTLAQYKAETFETLAYSLTLKNLVNGLGYPEELLTWQFDWRYMVRGLVVDKKRGNILKMDRHKYVKVAYHGFRELSRPSRLNTYNNTLAREAFDEPDYALIDTLFSLAEAYLFAQLVDFADRWPDKVPARTGMHYSGMYRDVRSAVDMCHRDGTLKRQVAADPDNLWDYTHVVMNHLCGKGGTRDDQWLDLFDVAVTGSAKPKFFSSTSPAPMFAVDPVSGMLANTDSGSPLAAGGNVGHLHRMLGIDAGAKVLYVGDHIYGDILRSKKQLGWRTMLVVPELDYEIQMLRQTHGMRAEFHRLRQQRDVLDDTIQRLEWGIRHDNYPQGEVATKTEEVQRLKTGRDELRERHRKVMRECHLSAEWGPLQFHGVWGQLMKTGYQNSRFAHQVERFACLYTSHVANICFYSPDKSYRTSEDGMPHECDIINSSRLS